MFFRFINTQQKEVKLKYIAVFKIPDLPAGHEHSYQGYEIDVPETIVAKGQVSELEAHKRYAASVFPRDPADIVVFVPKEGFEVIKSLFIDFYIKY